MTNNIIGVTLGPGVDLYVAATGGKLVVTPDGDTAAIVSVKAADPDPDPTPLPTGNLLPNGNLMDADGNVSFEGWFQSPDFFYDPPLVGPHPPLVGKRAWMAHGYAGWWLQADTDLLTRSAWLQVPGSARAWTEMVGELGPHEKLVFQALELPHLFNGSVSQFIEGWDPIAKEWWEVYRHSGLHGPNTDKRTIPATQINVEIDLQSVWFPRYRLTWDITLNTSQDAYMIGDLFLGAV